jgi:hypothetical protein
MAEVDLSVGPPSAPEVAAGVGDPVPPAAKPKSGRPPKSPPSSSTSSSEPAAPTGLDELDEPLPAVTMDQVRVVVMGAGLMLSMAFGDDEVPDHWRFSEVELAALVPPLTSIINRRPALRRAVQRGDELTVALVLAGYSGRNLDALRGARRARAQREQETDAREGETASVAGAAGARSDGDARVGAGGPAGGGVPRSAG